MKICFVSPDAYSLLDPRTHYIFGGAEIRAFTLARALKEKYHLEISFMVKKHLLNKKKTFFGMDVYEHDVLRGEGFWIKEKSLGERVKKKMKNFNLINGKKKNVFRSTGAEIFVAFGFSDMGLEAFNYCKANNKKFIFSLATDAEVERPEEIAEGKFLPLLKNSDFLICQTQLQQKKLQEKFSATSWLMPNPLNLNMRVHKKITQIYDALWIGKTSKAKCPERFLELVKKFPQKKFAMILNVTDENYFKKYFSSTYQNLELIKHVPFQEVESYFENSNILVNTSRVEGFANAFLQAAKYGKPVLSFEVDSGTIFSEYHCGICAKGNENEFYSSFDNLFNDKRLYTKISEAAQAYVNQFHSDTLVAKQFYECVLQKTTANV